jgi:hypothetical protein
MRRTNRTSPFVTIAAAVTDTGLDVRSRLTDARADTYVYERAADATSVRAIDIKLECRALIDEIEIAAASVPPVVDVLAPRPGRDDERVWSGPTGEPAVRAALLSPSLPRLRLRFAPAVAERVHLRLAPSARGEAWLIAGLVVRGAGCQAAETGP